MDFMELNRIHYSVNSVHPEVPRFQVFFKFTLHKITFFKMCFIHAVLTGAL